MPLKKEPCRNFQRGSCRFGDQCKFLHVTQQQTKSNVFGFGAQSGMQFQQPNLQQQKPNPFGFGVKNSSQPNEAAKVGASKQTHSFKPFENKWTRSSSVPTGNSASLQQPANQSQAANHKCSDPESCKRQIAEDFEHERPVWKLTCYSHYKYFPCDIAGDISYEELRAAAYDDAKRGLSLQSIVERERSLLSSKLIEFENLLRNPYSTQPHSVHSTPNPFPTAGHSVSSLTAQNSGPPSVSSFSQLGAILNTEFNMRPAPPKNVFEQFQNPSQTPSLSSTNSLAPALTGSQGFAQTGGSPFTSKLASFGNSEMSNQSGPFSSFTSASPQIGNSAASQSPVLFNRPSSANEVEQTSTNVLLMDNMQRKVFSGDVTIWLKEEWKLGEIPEGPPPDEFLDE
ncbi:hypothetical protein Nepgr_012555 [Nepenthes gracilis]|uniref:C3H1-type domain-containing protein n=1 Tax=Nepenthes gracilis TaxID=150966 RepID=A0AAD3SHH3_NEPGR|nr:hypothetical protein Nepgr_012555 [Nepenthes gracilis]